jgi:quinolinate synthase
LAALPFPELYRRLERHIPPFEWPILADDIAAILELEEERHAVILANNHQTPDIFHTVADSLALAREAVRTEADVIVLAGVHFMAETARLLNPDKVVLMPDLSGPGAPLRRRSRQPISGSCASAIRAYRS